MPQNYPRFSGADDDNSHICAVVSREIARKLIECRAQMDNESGYDCVDDPEGFLVSIVLAMRHWVEGSGWKEGNPEEKSWEDVIARVEAIYQEDLHEETAETQIDEL